MCWWFKWIISISSWPYGVVDPHTPLDGGVDIVILCTNVDYTVKHVGVEYVCVFWYFDIIRLSVIVWLLSLIISFYHI